MTSETDQLAHDFAEVNKKLAQYPQIHVAQTEGEPPATYEIEYQLNALTRQEDGSIDQGRQHLLRIDLPFGYPHFPPTVKPLTPFFHPDIDPDAVRITSYWQQNPSLADLIIHIGEMICAQKFNLDEPFNQEAADWYSEHTTDFPLDEIRKGNRKDESTAAGPLSLEKEGTSGLSLEAEAPEDNIQAQLDEIKHHIDKNEVVTAGKLLSALSSSSTEVQQLKRIVSSALAKRDALLQKLEELESEDRFSDAYEVFKKVREIAIDTPALSDIGQRLQQSQAMLDAFSQPGSTGDNQGGTVPQQEDNGAKKKKKKASRKSPEKTAQKEKPSRGTRANRPKIVIPVRTILASVVLVVVVGGCSLLYTKSMDTLMEAERDWIEIKYKRCTTPEDYKRIRVQAEKILVNIRTVYVPGIGKNTLEQEIKDHINDPDFRNGEEALPPAVIDTLEPIDQEIDKAAHKASQGKYTKALYLYQEARTKAEAAKRSASEPDAGQINQELDNRIHGIDKEITALEQQVQEEEENREFNIALEAYNDAITLFDELEDKKEDTPDLPDEVIISDQWDVCIEVLENAQRRLNEHPQINTSERQEKLKILLAYSELYQTLAEARETYEKGDLPKSIIKYQEAIGLLEKNRSALNAIYTVALSKIRKTVVVLEVSLELRLAVEAENQNDLTTALEHYKKVLQILRTSKVDMDDALDQLKQYIQSRINEIHYKIKEQTLEKAKSSTQEWWENNYKKIFKKEFPSTRVSWLGKPRIHFIKVNNGRLLYIIRCSERGITLELNYQYNLKTGTWIPYYGDLEIPRS
ncbi:MAG: hypothetical protein D3916_00850 [Candidatus Electrothrix sp. MAN1_4]|nr:hypothetical protein [Candidatus Electrothrix sp. MAN1_4]